MRILFFTFICLAYQPLMAQTSASSLGEGNRLYREQQYDKAEAVYEKLIQQQPSGEKAKFNRANAQHKQGKQEEAMKGYTEIAESSKDPLRKAAALYNKGVVLTKDKKLEESIAAYKAALRLNPVDTAARENLQKALLELKKKNPPKKEEKKDQQKKPQKKQQQPKMSQKEAEQRLKLLSQKEKEVNQRLQKEKSKTGGSQAKDW